VFLPRDARHSAVTSICRGFKQAKRNLLRVVNLPGTALKIGNLLIVMTKLHVGGSVCGPHSIIISFHSKVSSLAVQYDICQCHTHTSEFSSSIHFTSYLLNAILRT